MNSDMKIQYFIDYWRDLTHKHNSIENELSHSILYNPKELFKEFIEEIERKNLSNNDNKRFFVDKINEFAKIDLNALEFIKPILKLIQQQFSKKDDYSYLLHLLRMAQKKLSSFTIGKTAIKELVEILTNESDIDNVKIKHLVNLIIFELMHKKYSQETIIKIPDYIFSTYQVLPNDILHTDFPHDIQCSNWDVLSDEYQNYQKELKNFFDDLTNKDRLLALVNYLDKEAEELRFVFQIKGLKGDSANFKLSKTQIYNPKSTRLFSSSTETFNEFFEKNIQDDIHYCNGAVSVSVIDTEYAKQEALQVLDNTLDVIASRYMKYKTPMIINKFQYYVIDKDGNNRGSGATSTLEYFTYQDSIDLDNKQYDESIYLRFLSNIDMLDIDKKISESMHWERKAIEAIESNEKILWHWVTLENLFERKNVSTPKTIFDTISKLLAKKSMYDFAWKHFHKLQEMTNPMGSFTHYRQQLNLSLELNRKIGLNTQEGERIHLKNFIDNLGDIQTYINNDSLFYEQLEYLKIIFVDDKKYSELLTIFEKVFFEKLVYVYRIRNKIVHNAHSENSPIINYYVDFITLVSAISTGTFIDKRATLNLQKSEDIINNIIYEYDEFKLELKEKGTNILL